jgi:glycosyltransferase involved in cell wall biosynthesis
MSKSIAFLTMDYSTIDGKVEPHGCAWYRCWLPMHELQKLGWRTDFGAPEFNIKYGFGVFHSKEKIVFNWDIVVFKLIMMKSVSELLQIKNAYRHKIVIDVDDFYEGLQESNVAYHTTDPERNEDINRQHYWDIIEQADYLITSTQFLYDFYTKEKEFKNVFLVRNAIDLSRWNKRKDFSGGLPTVGWVGATPWRSNDLQTINPWFGKFLKDNHLPFHHSGHIKSDKIPSAFSQLGILPETKTSYQEREPMTFYPSLFRKFDIGIVPLSDIPFNHAKSTIKGLEYTAAGIPFISSYSPEYSLLERQGVGRVATSKDEWANHLEDLMNPKTRKEDIERNLENIKQLHTMEVRGEEWDKVFTQILES